MEVQASLRTSTNLMDHEVNDYVNLQMTLKFVELELVTFKKLSCTPLSFIIHYFFLV
jgi:hypothetical protein